jgi:hypothetical protein
MGATRMRSATYRAGQSVRGYPRNQSDLPALRIGALRGRWHAATSRALTLRNRRYVGLRLPVGQAWQPRHSRSCRHQPADYGRSRARGERRVTHTAHNPVGHYVW